MSRGAWRRLPPGGEPIGADEAGAALLDPEPARSLREGLRRSLGVEAIDLFASGRAALRELFAFLAARSGRGTIAMPAYCCFSVPAAAVAAGLRVRLLDVDARGACDPRALAAAPLDDVAAVVVANLFGIPEPLAPLRAVAAAAGSTLIDDAAQAFGAEAPDGRAGARGDVGLLSFGRGKPLSGLGGGALAWPRRPSDFAAPAAPRPARLSALLRALAWDAALRPELFRWLAPLPGLHIGETRFEPAFATGGIDGASLQLVAARLPRTAALAAARAARAEALAAQLRARTRFDPITAPAGARAVYPRLAVRAPDPASRDRALARLASAGLGASPFYPSALGAIEALRPHLAGDCRQPGAEAFAARVFTLPTHAGAHTDVHAEIVSLLAEA